MFFEITTEVTHASDLSEGIKWVRWTLRDGSEAEPGSVLCAGPDTWNNEPAARANIAAFRKKAGGMKFAKVVTA